MRENGGFHKSRIWIPGQFLSRVRLGRSFTCFFLNCTFFRNRKETHTCLPFHGALGNSCYLSGVSERPIKRRAEWRINLRSAGSTFRRLIPDPLRTFSLEPVRAKAFIDDRGMRVNTWEIYDYGEWCKILKYRYRSSGREARKTVSLKNSRELLSALDSDRGVDTVRFAFDARNQRALWFSAENRRGN